MKKVFIMLAMLTMTLAANAQFEQGNTFVGASLTGMDLNYSGSNKFRLGANAQAGLFLSDNCLAYGLLGGQYMGRAGEQGKSYKEISAGVGGRYYILQNGIFLGAGCKYSYVKGWGNDFKPLVEVGYAFFVSREVTIEPSVYYEQSFKNHSQFSTVGLKIGLSLYHAKNKLKTSVTEAFQ